MRTWAEWLFVVAAVGCSYRPARFHDRPPIRDAHDDRPIAIPRKSAFVEAFYLTSLHPERRDGCRDRRRRP